jgi:hypothetical protein
LLVLDDVLIGLDMANRLPALRLIEEEFANKGWQVFLMTFDRAWYEIAKQRLPDNKWARFELYAIRVGDYERPVTLNQLEARLPRRANPTRERLLLVRDNDHLDRALDFLAQGQVKAAAVHVRTEFELVLRHACEWWELPVRYYANPTKAAASELWAALRSKTTTFQPAAANLILPDGRTLPRRLKAQDIPFLPRQLAERIEHSVSWVLNPLSHSESVERYRAEIEQAIFDIDDLRRRVNFLKRKGPAINEFHSQLELIIRILRAREVELRSAKPAAGALPRRRTFIYV